MATLLQELKQQACSLLYDVIAPVSLEEDGEDEEQTGDIAKKLKPWGDSSYFCPVALKHQGVLWPGSEESAVKYRDKLYYCGSDEARGIFISNVDDFIAHSRPLQVV